MKTVFVALVALLAITACGDDDRQPKASPKPPTVEKNASYTSVQDLRKAVEMAGVVCPAFLPKTDMALAAEGGDCSDTTVLMTFATDEDKEANLEFFSEYGGTLLVGPNWIVNAEPDDLDKLTELGGTRWTRDEPEE